MTMAHFIGMMQDNTVDIEKEMGEPLPDILNNLLNDEYHWADKDITLNATMLPSWRVKGRESDFDDMLDNLDPELRDNADHLHNLVHEPETERYLERHPHADLSALARDDSGAIELQDDWNLPYKPGVRQVSFNDQVHTQKDFGS